MNIPYRTRRILYWVAVIAAIVILVATVAWLCWFTWLSRFVVYTRDGAVFNFSLSQSIPEGTVARPPEQGEQVPIYYNEGENAINTSTELTQLTGYYIETGLEKGENFTAAKVNEINDLTEEQLLAVEDAVNKVSDTACGYH